MATLSYWLWLTGRVGPSAGRIQTLLEHFGTLEDIYRGDAGAYAQVKGLSEPVRRALENKNMDEAERMLERCDVLGLSLVTIQDAHYPDCLKNISDPPPLLYYRGKLPDFDRELTIGMVGARKCTPYGVKMASQLGMELARAGAVVISGIAEGIDSQAITGALLGGGTVVSVLAGGIDIKFQSKYLYDDVAAAGALISEYPPGTPYKGSHFPVRNRIISGLSDGVVAVEGQIRSGTMITMDLALEQNRDTFAVPGPADAPMSTGTNRLIRMGWAKLITCAADILEDYAGRRPLRVIPPAGLEIGEQKGENAPVSQPKQPVSQEEEEKKEVDKSEDKAYIDSKSARELFTEDEQDILLALAERDLVADEVIELTQIPARRALSALTVLEVRGHVKARPGGRFAALTLLKKD